MLNVQNEISNLLQSVVGIEKITSAWSKDYTKLPLCYYTTSGNVTGIVTQEGEDTSIVQVTIHIFDKKLSEAKRLLSEIDKKLTSSYWSRTNYNEQTEDVIVHVQATYIVEIDVHTLEHYVAI